MSILIKIDNEERAYDGKLDEHWINQQISRRRADGQSVCVRVSIRSDDIDILLSTPTCATAPAGRFDPRPREKGILDLWNERGLNSEDFTGGDLIAFLKQLRRKL